jgi:hypothetical protein
VSSTTLGKIATGIAGTTGTGSLGISVFAVSRMTSAHGVPGGVWAALVALAAATAVISSLGLVLEYNLKKLEVEAQNKKAELDQELKRTRLEIHKTILEKAAGKPGSATSYSELIIADALYVAVEQNGAQPADPTHVGGIRTTAVMASLSPPPRETVGGRARAPAGRSPQQSSPSPPSPGRPARSSP